jgi:hypothetical protein
VRAFAGIIHRPNFTGSEREPWSGRIRRQAAQRSCSHFFGTIIVQSGAEINVVAHIIQQAVAPVFLLTGVGAILGVLTNRLARIVDRWRVLDERHSTGRVQGILLADGESHAITALRQELAVLRQRRNWIHRAITLCTICALLVCLVIATLFLGTEVGVDPSRLVVLLFVTAMLSLICGLLCFLREISLAASGIWRAARGPVTF